MFRENRLCDFNPLKFIKHVLWSRIGFILLSLLFALGKIVHPIDSVSALLIFSLFVLSIIKLNMMKFPLLSVASFCFSLPF